MSEPKRHSITIRVIAGLVVVVLVLWLLLGVGNFYRFDQSEEASRFGESFGFVNALFSALALAGVGVAIALQMQELKLQRAELKLTRHELSKSAEAQTQLVHLSALSALLQSYLAEYTVRKEEADSVFHEVVKHEPEKIFENLWYRILIGRAELESLSNGGTKESAVDKVNVSIKHLRCYLWVRELLNFTDASHQKIISLAASAPAHGITTDIMSTLGTLHSMLKKLESWFPFTEDKEVKDDFGRIVNEVFIKSRSLGETTPNYGASQSAVEAVAEFAKKLSQKYGVK